MQPSDARRRGRGRLSSCRRCRTQAEAEAKAEAKAGGMSWQQRAADQRAGQRQALGSRTKASLHTKAASHAVSGPLTLEDRWCRCELCRWWHHTCCLHTHKEEAGRQGGQV